MKLLMPFWDLAILPRYMPQFTALAKHVDRLTILYLHGEPPRSTPLRFQKTEVPRSLNRQHGMMRLMNGVHEQVNGIPFDTVYCLSGRWAQIAACNIAKETGTPLVIRIRGDEWAVSKIQRRSGIRSFFLKDPVKDSFKQASLVIPIAQKLIKVAQELGAKHITNPIPNGIDHTQFKPTPQPDNPTVGYIGRINVEKGAEFLQSLVHRTPNVHHLIAGPIQCHFNPTTNCDLLGPVPYKQIQDIYKASSIILIPSLIEGYPNALLEAYASARPIIITPGAHPEEAQLYGWKLPQNVESWARVLNHLRQSRLESLGWEAYEYSKGFTWKLHGERMAATIKTVHEEEMQEKFIQVKQEAPQEAPRPP